MNDQLKKRLVGAIVLVALGIIFIPMLLDGGKRSGIPSFGSNVPPKPDYEFKTLDIPLEAPKSHPAPDRPRVIEKPVIQQAKPVEQRPVAPKTVDKAAPAKAPLVAPKSESTASKNLNDKVQAWAVQVGSFSNSDNALKMRDKLRQAGFPRFVEEVKVSGKATYRVRVGPTLERGDAEAMMDKLAASQQLKGIVLRHP